MSKLSPKISAKLNKLLLLIELPFLPFYFPYIRRKISTKEGRKDLYLKAAGYIPFRRLRLFILDKIFVEESQNYTKPSYQELSGFVMDLKHMSANRHYIRFCFEGNYRYALHQIEILLKENGNGTLLPKIHTIIDVGSGSGIMTEAIYKLAKRYTKGNEKPIKIIGLDIRAETAEYNAILRPHITWGLMEDLKKYADPATRLDLTPTNGTQADGTRADKAGTLIVSNGVINFMTQPELEAMLDLGFGYFVWFYHTCLTSKEEVLAIAKEPKYIIAKEYFYTHYNFAKFLEERNYTFEFDLLNPSERGGYVHGLSKKKKAGN